MIRITLANKQWTMKALRRQQVTLSVRVKQAFKRSYTESSGGSSGGGGKKRFQKIGKTRVRSCVCMSDEDN